MNDWFSDVFGTISNNFGNQNRGGNLKLFSFIAALIIFAKSLNKILSNLLLIKISSTVLTISLSMTLFFINKKHYITKVI